MKEMNYKRMRGPRKFFVFLFFAAVAAFALGGIVMLLWNAILPALLNISSISYWQAVGLLLLCKILFGSFRPAPGGRRSPFGGPPAHLREKFMNMNVEQKEQFKQQWQDWCGERKDKSQ